MKRELAMLAVCISLGSAACAPVKSHHGYLVDDLKPEEITVGMDTKSTVMSRLGSPSTTSTFEKHIWYYMHAEREQYAFKKGEIKDRLVTEITFDNSDVVTNIKTYDLADGRHIDFDNAKTPTRGRELNIFEQIFGNIGRGSLPTNSDR